MIGLRALRERRLMTQGDLAKRLAVRYQTVSEWENGHSRPRVSAMRKLCEALDVTPEELIAALNESVAEGKSLAAA